MLLFLVPKFKKFFKRNIQCFRNFNQSVKCAGASGGFNSLQMISAYVGSFRQLHLRHSLFFSIMEDIKPNPQPNIKVFILHVIHLIIYYILISIVNRQRKMCQMHSNLLHFKLKCDIIHIYCVHLHLIYLLLTREDMPEKQKNQWILYHSRAKMYHSRRKYLTGAYFKIKLYMCPEVSKNEV